MKDINSSEIIEIVNNKNKKILIDVGFSYPKMLMILKKSTIHTVTM